MGIIDKIERRDFSSLYLLYGTEAFLINEVRQKLLANVLTDDEKEFNYSVYDMEDTPVEQAIEDAETYPFLGEQKLVIVQNPMFLTSLKTKDKTEHDVKKLETYLTNPSPYTVLVFSGDYDKLDERKKVTKLLKKNAEVMEAKPLSDPQLRNWLEERAKSAGTAVTKEAADSLMMLAGRDLSVLFEELQKLVLYTSDKEMIEVSDVHTLVSRSLEQNIFALTDNMLKGSAAEALVILNDLAKQNEEPIKILALIATQFRLIYQVKELGKKGYGQKHIAGMLKVHPYRVKLAADKSRQFSDGQLSRMMALIADCDMKLKSGSMDKSVMMELLMVKIMTMISQPV